MNRSIQLPLFCCIAAAGPAFGQSAYNQAVLDNNPLLYWTFDEAGGAAIEQVTGLAGDSLAPTGSATRTTSGLGPTPGISPLGRAASFDGSDGSIFTTASLSISPLNTWAYEFWFRNHNPSDLPTYYFELQDGVTGGGNNPAAISGFLGENVFEMFGGAGGRTGATGPIETGAFHHVVVGYYGNATNDGIADRHDIYLDGQLAYTGPVENVGVPLAANTFSNGALAIGGAGLSGGIQAVTGVIDEFAVYDMSTETTEQSFSERLADIAGHYALANSLPANPIGLYLEIDRATGVGRLVNPTTNPPVSLSGYEILSDSGSLDPIQWNSLEDQDYEGNSGPGNGWEEGGSVDSNALIETYLFGSSPVNTDQSIALGQLFLVGGAEDLGFRFLLADNSVSTGAVVYTGTTPLLLGDADGDGDVDAFDIAAVAQNFGNTGAADGSLLGDADHDGDVDAFDITAVEQNFGNKLPGSLSAITAPEPTSLTLLSAAGCLLTRRRRRD